MIKVNAQHVKNDVYILYWLWLKYDKETVCTDAMEMDITSKHVMYEKVNVLPYQLPWCM